MQLLEGRLFLHEHPATASSWKEADVIALSKMDGVRMVTADQCMFGLKTEGHSKNSVMPAKKPTKFMTNSWCIAKELDRRCDGSHVHQALLGGSRASSAAIYPEELCKAMCRGLLKEKKMRKGNTMPLMRVSGMHIRKPLLTKSDMMHEKDVSDGSAVRDSLTAKTRGHVKMVTQHECKGKQRICLLQRQDGNWKTFDDTTGLELDSSKVYEARIK